MIFLGCKYILQLIVKVFYGFVVYYSTKTFRYQYLFGRNNIHEHIKEIPPVLKPGHLHYIY